MKYIVENKTLTGIALDDEGPVVLRIPDGVKIIDIQEDDFDLWGIEEIDAIYLPRSVETIYAYSFGYDTVLRDLYFDGTLREWLAIEKGWSEWWSTYVGIGCVDYDLHVRDDSGRYYTVEKLVCEDIPRIGPCSFYGCGSLKSVEIRDAVVGECAFLCCRNLEQVYLYGAALKLEPANWAGETVGPFDDREDLVIHYSLDAVDSEYEFGDCECIYLLNPLLAETEENILELMEQVDDFTDDFLRQQGLYPDSKFSEKYRLLKSLADREEAPLFDRYDDEENEDTLLPTGDENSGRQAMQEDGLRTDTSDSMLSHVYSLLLTLAYAFKAYREKALPVLERCSGISAQSKDSRALESFTRMEMENIESLLYETGALSEDMSLCRDDIDYTNEADGIHAELLDEVFDTLEEAADALGEVDNLLESISDNLSDIVSAFDDPLAFTQEVSRKIRAVQREYGDISEEVEEAWKFSERLGEIEEDSRDCMRYIQDAGKAVEDALGMI